MKPMTPIECPTCGHVLEMQAGGSPDGARPVCPYCGVTVMPGIGAAELPIGPGDLELPKHEPPAAVHRA